MLCVFFWQLFDKETSTYTYLLADSNTKEAILIDPVRERVDRDIKLINELGLKLIYGGNVCEDTFQNCGAKRSTLIG